MSRTKSVSRDERDGRPNTVVHMTVGRPELPDTGVPCCTGSAVYGPHRCTCWEPVYDRGQMVPDESLPAVIGRECCKDCAFLLDSPERTGADGYDHNSAEDLERIAWSDSEIFYCHHGMRRVLKWVHPSGQEIEAHPGEYAPAIVGNQAYRADGTPAAVCAGLLYERRRLANEEAE